MAEGWSHQATALDLQLTFCIRVVLELEYWLWRYDGREFRRYQLDEVIVHSKADAALKDSLDEANAGVVLPALQDRRPEEETEKGQSDCA